MEESSFFFFLLILVLGQNARGEQQNALNLLCIANGRCQPADWHCISKPRDFINAWRRSWMRQEGGEKNFCRCKRDKENPYYNQESHVDLIATIAANSFACVLCFTCSPYSSLHCQDQPWTNCPVWFVTPTYNAWLGDTACNINLINQSERMKPAANCQAESSLAAPAISLSFILYNSRAYKILSLL